MNTHLHAPDWIDTPIPSDRSAAAVRQLVNACGAIANGMSIALTLVVRAQRVEDEGQEPPLDALQRLQLVSFCAVAAQMLSEVTLDTYEAAAIP